MINFKFFITFRLCEKENISLRFLAILFVLILKRTFQTLNEFFEIWNDKMFEEKVQPFHFGMQKQYFFLHIFSIKLNVDYRNQIQNQVPYIRAKQKIHI